MKRIYYLLFRLLFLLDGGVWSLRNLTISVPKAVLSGEEATLSCSYDLEGAALYSIRWYRSQTEFYRFVPREMPPTRVFPLSGATVDLDSSDDHQVRLRGLHRQLSGDYQCEVSADAPLFHTDIKAAYVTVVDTPLTKPLLTVDRMSYTRGDLIRANCSVSPSYPAANITWHIDNKKVTETVTTPNPADPDIWEEQSSFSSLEITIIETESYKVGLSYTSSSLSRAYPEPYQTLNHYLNELPGPREGRGGGAEVSQYRLAAPSGGQLTLSCASSIYDVYAERSDVVLVKEDAPHPASVTGEDSACGSPGITLFLLLVSLFVSCLPNGNYLL